MKPLKGIFENSATIWKVCQFLLLMLLTTSLALGLWALCFHGSQSTDSLKVMQLLQTAGTFLLPCLCGAWLWSRQPLGWLHLDTPIGWKESLLVIVLMICASPAINLLAWLNEQVTLPSFLSGLEEHLKQQEEAAAALTERFIKAENIGTLFFNILLMALMPALSEEMCFRGTLQTLFSGNGRNKHISVWVCAILFSAIHFQFYGFIPRMLMGALLGYMLLWSGSLWLPVLAHFTNNCMAVVLYNIYYMNGRNVDEIDAFGTGDTLWIGIVSIAVTGALIYLLRRSLTMSSASSRIS